MKRTVLGIDIGSTTISFDLIDIDTGEEMLAGTVPNDARISGKPYEVLYDPEKILKTVICQVNDILNSNTFLRPSAIGVTGQMHGILYADRGGLAVSPLYSWMDGTGDEPIPELGGTSAVDHIKQKTGLDMATGWGIATLFNHNVTGKIPAGAECICTISDYVASGLSGAEKVVMHSSNAASLGLFNLYDHGFRYDMIEKLGLDESLLPPVTDGFEIMGYYDNIPVSVAIGDNQASFIASVKNPTDTVLVNIGTGSQISYLSDSTFSSSELELRPLCGGQYISVGSSLCGGRALSMLESFLKNTVRIVTGENCPDAYKGIDRYLKSAITSEGEDAFRHDLIVDTLFCGTRRDPSRRGSIAGISADNFTPEEMIKGFMFGMVEELKRLYDNSIEGSERGHGSVTATGGAVRKSPYLRDVIRRVFETEVLVPDCAEAAAYGTAMFASVASGSIESIDKARKMIKYD